MTRREFSVVRDAAGAIGLSCVWMFDSLTIARQLTAGGFDREQADVLADAIRQAAEHGDHVTGDQFAAGIAEIKVHFAAAESRTYRAMLIQAGAIVGAVIAILRLLG